MTRNVTGNVTRHLARQKRYRERQRAGIYCRMVRVTDNDLRRLVVSGHLTHPQMYDVKAGNEAIEAFLADHLPSPATR